MESIFAGMQPRISDRDALQQWLDGLPDERRRQAAAVIAARAVLRALPMHYRSLSYFRASALAWVAARYPDRAGELPTYFDYLDAFQASSVAASGSSDACATDVAVTAFVAPGVGDFWHLVSADVAALEGGRSPSALAGEPLLPKGAPSWTQIMWGVAGENLQPEHWRSWKDWYQRRLDGRELSEDIEFLFATLSVDPDVEDIAAQTRLAAREIARLMDRVDPAIADASKLLRKPDVPKPKPAAIEPIAIDGKIRLREGVVRADLDTRALNAALRALKQQFADLVANLDAESNIDKRATASLRRIADLIPMKRPTQEQLFRLAHEQEKLEAYASSVVEEWPRTLAADYLAATRAFDRTVRQFPKWREFKTNAEKDRLTAEQREATPRIADDFAYALREDEAAQFVEQGIASIVSDMASRLAAQRDAEAARFDPIAAGADLLAEDLVTSMENLVKAIAEVAISPVVGVAGTAKRAGMKFARQADKSIVKEAGRLGDGFGPALTKWAKRALIGTPVAGAGYGVVKTGLLSYEIQKLMHAYPHIAKWLKPILDFLS